MSREPGGAPVPTLSVPDIRDYDRINAELVQHLDQGHAHVRIQGAEGQRLLVAGLAGAWNAVVEVEGRAGPELAAGLNAPNLKVVCQGAAADGAGRSLRAGRLLILGDAGPALGYAMEGGAILAAGSAGPRAGLNQRGGVIAILGNVGPLAAERQTGGQFFVYADRVGPHWGRGTRGGRLIQLTPGADELASADAEVFQTLRRDFERWLPNAKGTGSQ